MQRYLVGNLLMIALLGTAVIGLSQSRPTAPVVATVAAVAVAEPLLPAPVPPPPPLPEPPPLAARAALVAKLLPAGTPETLLAHNEAEPVPLASLTKLMTALVVARHYNVEEPLTVGEQAAAVEYDPAVYKPGEVLPVHSLLNSLLVESSNVAANLLAGLVGEEEFTTLMNQAARELKLSSATFYNPSGLDPAAESEAKPNVANARDVAALAAFIARDYPALGELTLQPEAAIMAADGATHHLAKTTDDLLLEPADLPFHIVLGKTGQTTLAKKNLVLVVADPATRERYVLVVLGADDHFAQMRALLAWLKGATSHRSQNQVQS